MICSCFTHRLHPLSWAMHDKRAVERSPQGPGSAWNLRAPPFVPGACRLGGRVELAAEAPKEEQATLAASVTDLPDHQHPSPVSPSAFWRHAICAISCLLHEIHSISCRYICLDHSCHPSELVHQQHTAPLVTDQTMVILWLATAVSSIVQGSSLPKSRVLQGPGASRLIGGLSTGRGPHSWSRTTPAGAPADVLVDFVRLRRCWAGVGTTRQRGSRAELSRPTVALSCLRGPER